MKQFKNLIFDLGDVIIDIDINAALQQFQKLAIQDFSELLSNSNKNNFLYLFETGKITADQFRSQLKLFLKPSTTDKEINTAWNSIITNYPESKFKLLQKLKLSYRTFALSNTNEIHVATFNNTIQHKFGGKGLEDFFHGVYYSNELGFRKPDKEIYELVLQKENLNPDETFFVDDLFHNIETAKKLNIHAYQLTDRNKLFELLAELHII